MDELEVDNIYLMDGVSFKNYKIKFRQEDEEDLNPEGYGEKGFWGN